MGELGFCTMQDIVNEVGKQFLMDSTTDVGWPFMFIRFLHNKLVYGLFFSLRCYGLYFDSLQLVKFISVLWLPFIIWSLVWGKGRKVFLLIQLIFPLFLILNPLHLTLGPRIEVFKWYYVLLGSIGTIKFLIFLKNKFISWRKNS